jgi:hypothetical protein
MNRMPRNIARSRLETSHAGQHEMIADEYGIEGIADEDRAYKGSLFSEVRHAVFSEPYGGGWTAPGRIPVDKVTLWRVLHGILSLGRRWLFRQATERTVDSRADLRWGPNREGFRRLLHPNGICLSGTWEITEDSGYTGYFSKGSKALLIGRYSTCCSVVRRGRTRSLSLVGKLFPTTDEDHATRLETANFFTQQDIGGDDTPYINDAILLNAPNTTATRRGGGIGVLLVTGAVFGSVDREPTIRQLYEIAELGKPDGEPTRAPAYMRLLVAAEQRRIEGIDLDFRDEIMMQIADEGAVGSDQGLTFTIEVTNDGETTGPDFRQRRTFRNWRSIGTIKFDTAAASYNGDHVIHFNHPTWRRDRNNPATATRIDGRKQ